MQTPTGTSAADAAKFIADAEKKLSDLSIKSSRTSWVQATFITDDTEIIAAEASDELSAAVTTLAKEAAKFNGVKVSPENQRKLELLKLALTVPARAIAL